MNPEIDTRKIQYALLDDVLSKGIEKNEEQCKIWRAYKTGHEKVAEALQTFQKDLYVNCMVPIGKRALMKGRLIHTNEVLAFLGDGYFAKYSAAGAIALCQRRIQNAEEMLKKLSTERDLYETRMMVTENDFFEDCAGTEIVEHWNEEQIDEWRKKHREREKEYHQKLTKLRQDNIKKIETEEDLFNRLDQLEIEEELADELNRLEDEVHELFGEELKEGECYYESESSSESEENDSKKEDEDIVDSEKKQPEENVKSNRITKSVSFAVSEDNQKKEKDENLKKSEETNNEDVEEGSVEDILRIEFSHSSNNPTIKSDGESIQSPADIYKMLSKPKSILKRSPNDIPVQAPPPDYSTEEEEEEESNKPSAYESVVKDIQERNTTAPVNDVSKTQEHARPISKFKRDRQKK
ncbi:unconventional prefoldin RPB5 interactor [Megachile rotundata]|uniref:unconventional prefoldin RPB5 interactor n=1 Tax=Megachile rotundata TaxID=143995 RepID=UPI000258E13C|nr:PREDICTED: unconventional prefoldin RPB5 interactor 1 [Megachile rotundata]